MAWKPVMNFNLHRYLSCKAIAGMAGDGLYRTSFFMAFANIMSAGCGFFFWIIAARLYALEQVGLAGDLRRVPGLERRIGEAARLGFELAVVPAGNRDPNSRLPRMHG